MTRVMLASQPMLPFVAEMDRDMKARNQAHIERSIRERYPMTDEERSCLPAGVRLARFVPFAECEACRFACEDHTVGWQFPTNICLKDWRKHDSVRSQG